jgi:hypothetical protein
VGVGEGESAREGACVGGDIVEAEVEVGGES